MKRNIVQKKFEAEILDLYTRLKKALPRIQEKYEADALETFVAQCGRDFPLGKNTGILFYGRSNNGWNSKNPLTMDELPEQLRRPFFNLIRQIRIEIILIHPNNGIHHTFYPIYTFSNHRETLLCPHLNSLFDILLT